MTVQIDWMGGSIPPDWGVFKLKHVLREEKKETGGNAPAGAISFGEVVLKDFDNDETLATYRMVRRGQFLINPLNLNYDLKSLRIGLSKIDCRVSPAYIVASNDEGVALAGYLRWALRVFDVQHMKTLGAGVRQTVKFEDIGECRIALPSLEEQQIIADQLHREASRIDALVERKTRFIELLREKRQALITHAVTKGLDASVPMKDSGVEWLGDVPAHWRVLSLKRDIVFMTSGSRGWAEHYSESGDIFLRIGNLERGDFRLDLSDVQRVEAPSGAEGERTKVKAGDLLFSITAYLGSIGVVPEGLGTAYVSQHIALVRLSNRYLLPKWAAYFAISNAGTTYLDLRGYGGTKVQLSLADVAEIPLTAPPITEQHTIVAHLDHATTRIDVLIAKTERSIDLLREHRTALITTAVTGKLDLRDAA